MTHFVCADHHFGHAKALEFRKEFADLDSMHRTMIHSHNRVVTHSDTVYFLGDVVWFRHGLKVIRELNGRKILVPGNHDRHWDLYSYAFQEVRGDFHYPKGKGAFLSHVPIHPDCVDRFGLNVHGHLHDAQDLGDPRYICVSMECINYTPVDLDQLILGANQ